MKRHDTRITLHSIENDIDKIVVQTRDTDVLVVLDLGSLPQDAFQWLRNKGAEGA